MPRQPALRQITMLGPHAVPGIWRYMLPPAVFDLAAPRERRASCNDCPRIASDKYRPDYRCCTYHPRVPNFMLGLALEQKPSRAAVERAHAAGMLMPEGMQPSPHDWANFLTDVGEDRFGKSTDVLCPMLEQKTGRCGIYAFRNAVCSTFFCHYDHGKVSERFWERLQTFVLQTEMALGQWALRQVGFDVAAYIKRMNAAAKYIDKVSDKRTGHWSAAARQLAWGDAFGRELEVYAECAAVVEKNADRLWELANEAPIMEPLRFELAAQSVVPEAHRDQIEDEFDEDELEGRDTARPREMWRTVLRAHERMTRLPVTGERLKVSDKILLSRNDGEDPEALHELKKGRTIRVDMLKRAGAAETVRWRDFITTAEAAGLGVFVKTRAYSAKTRTEVAAALEGDADAPDRAVAEWLGKGFLMAT